MGRKFTTDHIAALTALDLAGRRNYIACMNEQDLRRVRDAVKGSASSWRRVANVLGGIGRLCDLQLGE